MKCLIGVHYIPMTVDHSFAMCHCHCHSSDFRIGCIKNASMSKRIVSRQREAIPEMTGLTAVLVMNLLESWSHLGAVDYQHELGAVAC